MKEGRNFRQSHGRSGGGPEVRRAFLVGAARSGTTLLQALLGSHPRIATFPESHMFRVSFEGGFVGYLVGGFRARRKLDLFIRRMNAAPDGSKLSPPARTLMRGRSIRAFLDLLDGAAQAQGKDVWLEKTPGHVLYIEQIQRYVPDARFVHLIRDGRAVVTSLYRVTREKPGRRGDGWTVARCVVYWNRCVRASLERVGQQHSHLALSYDELTNSPDAVLRRVCGFLELDFEADMLRDYREIAATRLEPFKTWPGSAWEPIRDRGLGAYETLFTEEERAYIEEQLIPLPEWVFHPSRER